MSDVEDPIADMLDQDKFVGVMLSRFGQTREHWLAKHAEIVAEHAARTGGG